MAITRGALFSMNASGAIANALVYSSWKGISYARSYVIPANPRSVAQTETRSTFQWVHDAYKLGGLELHQTWDLLAKGNPLTGGNSFTSHNLSRLRGQTGLAQIIMSDGAKGGFGLSSLTLTPGTGQIGVAFTIPTMPPGWVHVGTVIGWIKDMAPSGEGETGIQTTEVLDPTLSHTLTGLTTGSLYWVGAWLHLTKPDMTPAYGGQTLASATPT